MIENARMMQLLAQDVVTLNAVICVSDSRSGQLMLEHYPVADMAMAWHVNSDGRCCYVVWSREGGMDVSILAESLGGTGTKNKASFETESPFHELTHTGAVKRNMPRGPTPDPN